MAAQPRKVAVIGAGPAGLSMADQLLSVPTTRPSNSSGIASTNPSLLPSSFKITLFDRRDKFGGVWGYDPSPGLCIIRYDARGKPYPLWAGQRKDGSDSSTWRPPGAMYDGLRTNLPCDIMTYRSHPYDNSTSLFPDRATVESYIEAFGKTVLAKGKEHGGLEVRLKTAVNSVRRIAFDGEEAKQRIGWGSKWSVTSISLDSGQSNIEEFDHVVLASGRCNTPQIPFIPGLRHFKGQILHSAWWRTPLPFENKTVLVVGNSSSGSDIARELSGYILRTLPEGEAATKAYIARCDTKGVSGRVLHSYEQFDKPPPLDYDPRDPDSPEWSRRIVVMPKLAKIEPSTQGKGYGKITFENGEVRDDVDVIIFGTGYVYDFPYLDYHLSPFDLRPLIPTARASVFNSNAANSLDNASSKANEDEEQSEVYTPPNPTSTYLSNLDDWSLFYKPDASLCVLGAPIRIVPMPLTHVQSRIVAASWSGLISPFVGSNGGLPRLDPQIPSTDAAKWTSRPNHNNLEPCDEPENNTSDLGYPSDSAYQDALLALLPDQLSVPGQDQNTKVLQTTKGQTEKDAPEEHDKGETIPVVATDEGWSRMPNFRNQRRQDTKRLRRLLLGY
ncbi:related to FMO1 - flavin-containing monooxygenase [Melanopsichium pennsylvanicum]|uniref:Related to FMO1 - flavin-containing monooxygenase n=2 Tax=Melanopsichium pennsylvanicum TaxID=63383 RepID=A0AAJ5C2H4_9BASI|nr:fad nad-binding domain-containing protein [Melanopsichium pennsylvanicum 4]SNX81541.1 related to FMO1 - flavin-containing monooxygenase [Melanopsichium pennsylvanicum]